MPHGTQNNKSILRRGWNSVLDLFYPPLCEICGEAVNASDDVVCDECLSLLATTEHASKRGNRVEAKFEDEGKFIKGGAYCAYAPDSAIRTLIHKLKYSNRPKIGIWLGETAAREFMEQNATFFSDIDIIVPVPLHKDKLRQRGYNQAALIAEGISHITGISIDTHSLIRARNNDTQTHLSLEQRATNVAGVFDLSDTLALRGKHVLLVDDVVTSGATLHDCMRCLRSLRATKYSVMTMAVSVY